MTLLPLSGPLRTVGKGNLSERFYTAGIPHTQYSSLCILYFTPTQFQTSENKQGKFSSFLFQSFFSGFSLSSPTSLLFCCFHTAGSWLAQDRETFNKHKNEHLTNAFLFPQ